MRRARETVGALRRSERGFTLIELLVATTVGMVVLGGAVTIFLGAVRSEPRTAAQVTAVQQGRVTVERITREVRQGLEVLTAGAGQLQLITLAPQGSCGAAEEGAEPCRVTYTCTAAACSRAVAEPDGGSPGAAVQVASGLASTEVFEYAPNTAEPTYVDVELSFAMDESGPVVIADGATMRNVGP